MTANIASRNFFKVRIIIRYCNHDRNARFNLDVECFHYGYPINNFQLHELNSTRIMPTYEKFNYVFMYLTFNFIKTKFKKV